MSKRYWIVRITYFGFESLCLAYGTERELQEYFKSEIGYIPSYWGARTDEINMARKLGIKAYLCPELD